MPSDPAILRSDITMRLTWPGESDNDWLVLRRGEVVGRIHYAVEVPRGRPPWFWYCNQMHFQKHGTAPSLEAGKEAWLSALAEMEKNQPAMQQPSKDDNA